MNEEKEKLENDEYGEYENPFVELEFKEVANTSHEHYYVEDPVQDPNNEMTQLICTGCPSGCSIADDLIVIDGKIIKK